MNGMAIIDISDRDFRSIFADKRFDLPRRWDGRDFLQTLGALFSDYESRVTPPAKRTVAEICSRLFKVVRIYFMGSPSGAYSMFKSVMNLLWRTPLLVEVDELERPLFRLACVGDNAMYDRKRIFHTPYTLRAKVSTSRYSIAGHPSLYLGTSLPLCQEELHLAPQDFAIAAAYHFRPVSTVIRILDLGIKPGDFLEEETRDNTQKKRVLSSGTRWKSSIKSSYVFWYPLIAACSFIRVNKKDPFAAEYIIPQLLMQWVQNQMLARRGWPELAANNNSYGPRTDADLIGIRYFSCASKRASDMGFDYVFPTSGEQIDADTPYCPRLNSVFEMTEPAYLVDYPDAEACERYLCSILPYEYKDISS